MSPRSCLELWVHDQDLGAGVVDYELHLFAVQPEVDWNSHPAKGTRSVEEHEQAGSIVGDHCYPGAEFQAQIVQPDGH
jgi:hypothetical protein